MKSDKVILAAKLLEEHVALHEAIGKVKKKVWVDRGDEEPVGYLLWHEARFDKLPFTQHQVSQILNNRLEVVNAALAELGVEL